MNFVYVIEMYLENKFLSPGHVNHSIFWKNLAPVREGGGEPLKGSLGWAIDTHFGSLEALAQKMSAEGAALQGSGWVFCFVQWFGVDKELKKLVVETTANQVIFKRHLISVFGIDIIILSLMIFLSMVSDPLVTKGPSLVPLIGIDV
ncbi:superoxide dismutase [Mn], mitochondrial-like isoform X2 [Punica granatum]|uniref:superoxide dismutase n=1 Tax=Punica granatum TaxID=22663 RepID=A0A6P8BQA9_PUNGR|nr:superoxide dismutase [Mn], mitochondrial-like isoform X2 [Punica granatum]